MALKDIPTDQREPRATQLVAVNIPTAVIEREKLDKQNWWYNFIHDKDVWVTATCSRVLAVTSKEHWDNVLAMQCQDLTSRTITPQQAAQMAEIGNPDPFQTNHPAFMKREGWDAYKYLLESSCGLHSHELGEEHVFHQILDQGYRNHNNIKNQGKASWFDPIVRDLKHDARQVRNIIGPHILPTAEDTAREITNLNGQKHVLIVTDSWEHAQGMVYALLRDSAPVKPSHIDVVYIEPRSNAVGKIQIHADNMANLYKWRTPIREESLSDILAMGCDWIRDYEAIFVVSPINKYPAKEQELMEAWKACGEARPKLVALRLDPANEIGLMELGALKDDRKAIAILPDIIEEELKRRQEQHDTVLKEGQAACDMCATLREKTRGQHHPRGNHLRLPYAEYTELSRQYSAARHTAAKRIWGERKRRQSQDTNGRA